MELKNFLQKLEKKDIQLVLKNGKLFIDAPKGMITEKIKNKISKRKQKIISYLKQDRKHDQYHYLPELSKKNIKEGTTLPLNETQLHLWFIYVDSGETANLNLPLILKGPLNVSLLEKSINYMLNHHQLLRANISTFLPALKIMPVDPIDLSMENWAGCSQTDIENRLGNLNSEFNRPFDLEKPPLIRIKLLKLENEKHFLFWSMPHIVCDGAGIVILIKQLQAVYSSLLHQKEMPMGPVDILYSDYIEWEKQVFAGQYLQKDAQSWENWLKKVELPEFPARFIVKDEFQYQKKMIPVEPLVYEKIQTLSKQKNVTFQMIFVTLVGITIHLTTGQSDFCVNSILENRVLPGLDKLIAPLFKVMPIIIQVNRENSFNDVLNNIRKNILKAYELNRCPWPKTQGIIFFKRWKHASKAFVFFLKGLSRLLAFCFKKARLYPEFLSDSLYIDYQLSYFSFKNLFKKKKKPVIPSPIVSVNILQSFFNPLQTETEANHSAQALDQLSISMPNNADINIPNQEHEVDWERDVMTFYLKNSPDNKPFFDINVQCFTEEGFKEFITTFQTVLSFLLKNNETPISKIKQAKDSNQKSALSIN